MRLRYSETAAKDMRRLPKARSRRLAALLRTVAAQPFARHAQVTAIKGAKDTFRVRLGRWRAVYKIDRASRTMTVITIQPRGSAYR